MRRESTFHAYHQQDILVVFSGAELQAPILDLSLRPLRPSHYSIPSLREGLFGNLQPV